VKDVGHGDFTERLPAESSSLAVSVGKDGNGTGLLHLVSREVSIGERG
jgi:hypothetical protein